MPTGETTAGLQPLALKPLGVGTIRPSGWLERQLRIQADGLTGHLDEFWPDIKESGWIGGKAEGWERAPYWLDGLVPLAFILDDEALKAKAHRWVNYIREHQQPNGWLGPVAQSHGVGKAEDQCDVWPIAIIMKVFSQYQEATEDERVIPAMLKAARCIGQVLDEHPLRSWAQFRWMDLAWVLHWLYDRTGDAEMLAVAAKLHVQGFDWRADFEQFKYPRKIDMAVLNGFRDEHGPDFDRHGYHATHVVNNGMAMKAPGVWWRQSHDRADRDAIFAMLETLDRYHGQAGGVFSGDEHLATTMPSQGTETCAVVEYLFSLEVLLAITGDPRLADRLERIAFNALPAPFKPDMWARQYVQQANQVMCAPFEDRVYTNNGPDANMYGFETNFGCCTANMHQGWPKFAAHLWAQNREGGLTALSYAPCKFETRIAGAKVKVEVDTEYPFEESVRISLTTDRPMSFPVKLRIPSWAEGATVRDPRKDPRKELVGCEVIERIWEGRTTIELTLPMKWRAQRRYNDAVTLSRGALVFSLHVRDEWKHLKGELPHATWQTHPTSAWNYALAIDPDAPGDAIELEKREIGEQPFSPEGAALRARVPVKRLPEWGLEHNAAAPPPVSPVRSDEPVEQVEFIPYGCCNLRMTELPVVVKKC